MAHRCKGRSRQLRVVVVTLLAIALCACESEIGPRHDKLWVQLFGLMCSTSPGCVCARGSRSTCISLLFPLSALLIAASRYLTASCLRTRGSPRRSFRYSAVQAVFVLHQHSRSVAARKLDHSSGLNAWEASGTGARGRESSSPDASASLHQGSGAGFDSAERIWATSSSTQTGIVKSSRHVARTSFDDAALFRVSSRFDLTSPALVYCKAYTLESRTAPTTNGYSVAAMNWARGNARAGWGTAGAGVRMQ